MVIKAEEGGLQYSFEFKCADFSVEFKGDLNFVQTQLYKYEPKILVKIAQLVPVEKTLPPQRPQQQPQQQRQQQPPPRQQQPQQQRPGQPQQQKQQQYRDDRRRGHDKRRGQGYKQGRPEEVKKDEKAPTRDPDFLENRERVEQENPKPVETKNFAPEVGELRELLERHHPQTSHDRVMIFAYHIEDRVQQEFTTAEISECYSRLGERAPGNLHTVLNNASRSGFLVKDEKGGKAKYRLTFKGKRYVDNGLRLD